MFTRSAKFLLLALPALGLLGCEKDLFLKPDKVNSEWQNKRSICVAEQRTLAYESVVAAILIEQVSKWIVEGLSDALEDEVKKYTSVYEGSAELNCDVGDINQSSSRFVFFPKDRQEGGAIVFPLKIQTDSYFYAMNFNPKNMTHNWEILKPGDRKWNGSVVMNIKWVTYARDGEKTLSQTVFDNTIAALKIRDGMLDESTGKNERRIVGVRPAKSVGERHAPQLHKVTWTLTLLDESLSAKALRKIHATIAKKSDDLTEEVAEELKEVFRLDD